MDLLKDLINELSKLPGIGEKSAARIAFHIIKEPMENGKRLSQSIIAVKENIRFCSNCFNLSESDPCSICNDLKRDEKIVCIVEDPSDLWAIEGTHFKGRYHVLHGLISPLNGIGPNDLKLNALLQRIERKNINEGTEIFLALNPTVEGEATSMYIKQILSPFKFKITKIAYGLPVGSDLEYIDKLTLTKALEFRRILD